MEFIEKGRVIHLNSAVLKEFKAAGINFPLPRRDVFEHQVCEKAQKSYIHSGEEESTLII